MGKKCSLCGKLAHIIENKIYYCAPCELKRKGIKVNERNNKNIRESWYRKNDNIIEYPRRKNKRRLRA
jgi:hypothetical protein